MKRKLRTDENLQDAFNGDPDLKRLYDKLKAEDRDDRLEVDADGEGACIFKVYLSGHKEADDGFLRALTPLHKSYVNWQKQKPCVCPDAFSKIVKKPDNKQGSELQQGVVVDDVVAAVLAFLLTQ